MTANARTRNRLSQALHGLVSLYLADPFFSERERECAEALGLTHFEYIAEKITEVLFRDFRIDHHADERRTRGQVKRRLYDVLFDNLVGWQSKASPLEPETDPLDLLCEEIGQALVTDFEIETVDA